MNNTWTIQKNKMKTIEAVTYIKKEYMKNIVLINFEIIAITEYNSLEGKNDFLTGFSFKIDETNDLIDFYEIIGRPNTNYDVILEYQNIGWGKILAKGNTEILKYFEEYDTIERYFEIVHLPQLTGMINVES